MKLGYVIIYVPKVEETIQHWTKAFGLELLFMHESKTYAELQTGKTTLAFGSEDQPHKFEKNKIENKPAGFEVALISENVETSYQHAIDNGAIAVSEPSVKPWGQTVSYVRDMNGILVEICSEIKK